MSGEFKRYALVSYSCYYPIGFEDDVLERFETVEDAKLYIVDNKVDGDFVYIFDLIEWERVWEND